MRILPLHLLALWLAFAPVAANAAEAERTGGPYVPTPQVVVDSMHEIAGVGPRDFVIDLGSGDGRIVLTAAQRYRARGLGVDIDGELVKLSNTEAQKRGLAERVSFREQDVMKARIDEATVVTLYLLPGMMTQLQAKFTKELKAGTRIVSHDFPFGDWRPDREVSVDVPEKYGTPGQWKSTIYFWVVPARVQGEWVLDAPGLLRERVTLTLEQQYQFVQGGYTHQGKRTAFSGRLDGHRIALKLALPGGTHELKGVVEGGRMRGEVADGARTVPWTAQKAAVASVSAR